MALYDDVVRSILRDLCEEKPTKLPPWAEFISTETSDGLSEEFFILSYWAIPEIEERRVIICPDGEDSITCHVDVILKRKDALSNIQGKEVFVCGYPATMSILHQDENGRLT